MKIELSRSVRRKPWCFICDLLGTTPGAQRMAIITEGKYVVTHLCETHAKAIYEGLKEATGD